MNRALVSDWILWLERAAKWLAYGPPLTTPVRDRCDRLDKILEEGRRLSGLSAQTRKQEEA
jgi:hypothetical protein